MPGRTTVPVALSNGDGNWGSIDRTVGDGFADWSRTFGTVPLASASPQGSVDWSVTNATVGAGFGKWATELNVETAFQPSFDYDMDGCYPVPAIDPDGVLNPGLPGDTSTTDGGCRDMTDLDVTSSYSRCKCNHGWCGIVHILYLPRFPWVKEPNPNM